MHLARTVDAALRRPALVVLGAAALLLSGCLQSTDRPDFENGHYGASGHFPSGYYESSFFGSKVVKSPRYRTASDESADPVAKPE